MHQNGLIKYADALIKNDLKPRFAEWLQGFDEYKAGELTAEEFRAMNPNYMKLVNETRRASTDTPTVQPIFTLEDGGIDLVQKGLDEMESRGGFYESIGRTNDNMLTIAGDIAEDIRSGKKPDTIHLSSNGLDADTEGINETSSKTENVEDDYSYPAEEDALYTQDRWYSYDFLTHQKDMEPVFLPPFAEVRSVDENAIAKEGLKDAEKYGTVTETPENGKIVSIKNDYTNRIIKVSKGSIKHGIEKSDSYGALILEKQLGERIGQVAKYGIPINGLKNRNSQVHGTYALAGYARDIKDNEYIAIITVEHYSGNIVDSEIIDVGHSIRGRIEKGRGSVSHDVKSPKRTIQQDPRSSITIAELLEIVNSTHRGILSKDVLDYFGEERPTEGDYAKEVLFSQLNVDTDTETAVSAEEIERNQNTQEPLQDTGITDNRFTEALKKIGVNNITGSLVDYAGIEVEQQTARTAAEARRYLRRVLKETKADPRTQAFAHDVARGIYTMDDLPNTMSRGIVEELADAYRFAESVVQDSLAYKRRQINAGLDADARKLFADSDNYNPAKFGRLSKTLMNERTPARVLRSIFGEEKGGEIYEAYWRPIIENNAAAKLWKNKQREDVKTFRDSKGTKKEERPLLFLMFGGKKFGGKNMNEIGNMKKQKPANH